MILLTNETANILYSSNENYNNKIQKLKNAGLLNKNDEFYNNDKDVLSKYIMFGI